MSHRKAQIESAIKRSIAQILIEEMSDPRVLGMISVTKVQVTQDLREAFVFVSVLPEKLAKKTLHGLVHAQGFVQNKLNKSMVMHHPPKVQFRLDEAFVKNNKALAKIARLAQKAQANAASTADQGTAPTSPEEEKNQAEPS
jgi:ribosome-binding factor A